MSGHGLSAEIERRIFIVGVPRSGTTLVQSLLAAHGALTSFTESHFFDRHFRLLAPSSRALLVSDPGPRLREFLAENDEPPPAAAAWFGAAEVGLGARALLPLRTRPAARRLLGVLDELARRRGAAGWVEKTPRHLRYLPFLERLLAGAGRPLFVHVIRQGLEVVASLKRASRDWERPYDLAACARRWNADVAFSLRRIGAPGDRFVFYEELTERPAAVLERLCVGLGLDWQPRALERYAGASGRLVTDEERGWKGGVGRGIRPSATAERTLSAEERRRVARLLRPDLYARLRDRAGRAPAARGGPGA